MNRFTFGSACLALVIGLAGCSRKKDTFINRNWHAVTTEYNTLYNGDLSLDLGKKQIAETYQDNFWEILPVERMQVSQEILLPGTVKNENFQLAEEKATKAIQRHSMLIQGREKNPQIDEAYLLLGKARYYDQRFIPALEAFNYILHKYPASNTINHAQIWREKTNIRLENDRLAIKNLKKLIRNSKMADQDWADAHAILAQAYINTGALDSAVVPIKIAARYTKNNDERGRYYYITGQLYNRLQLRDSANLVFEKIIELHRRTPREYLVNARLEKARNFNFSQNEPGELLEYLQEMEEDRENRPFLDKIYFQLAEYYNHLDSINLASEYYNKSLRTLSPDNFLQSVNYESLAKINFERADYRKAGAYFDSTLTKIPSTTRDYFVIKRKRDNLEEVILYEEIAERNDSILRLVGMSDGERLSYFKKYTDDLKATAIRKAKEGVDAEIPVQAVPPRRGPGGPPSIGSSSQGSNFYFYNNNRVATGMQEFLRVWGPRELADNWRNSSGNVKSGRSGELDEVSELIIANNPEFDPQMYLEKIPSKPAVIDSLKSGRDDAYYRLGLIYKEKFRENQLASEKLMSLLDFTSEEKHLVPALYNLYLIKQEEGSPATAEGFKRRILEEYPESRYASRLINPGKALGIEDEAAIRYSEMYQLFEAGEFGKVLELGEQYREQYEEHELLPKMELLDAMTIGRLLGFEAYKEALSKVARNFPQTEEGKKAQQLINTTLPRMAEKEFKMEAAGNNNIKMLYSFTNGERQKAESIKEIIDTAISELGYKEFTTSLDVYNTNKIFVVIHGLGTMGRAEGFAELLQVNTSYKIEAEPVLISSENYRIVQLHKNLDNFIEFRNQN